MVECEGRYVVGKQSLRYRLTPAYHGEQYRQHVLDHGEVVRAVLAWRAGRDGEAARGTVWGRLRDDLTTRVTAEDWGPSVALALIHVGQFHHKVCRQTP